MKDFEKLGAFYLGRRYDPDEARTTEDLLLYDSKDLTTHAVCVGMTGSGKTGLCVSLLEEAAIDGIPALAIDPKGDLGNLLLTFPDLAPSSFEPWVDADEASRSGRTVPEQARHVANLWQKGLADWGQGPERIQRLRDKVELAIYTPGSSAGRPVRVLQSLAAPPPALLADADALRERVESVVSGLLALLGIEADPLRSPEHVLLARVLHEAWEAGRSLDLAALIGAIQSPPFDRLGVMDLESFFPARERRELAMRVNALLASPGFASWMEGEPLDIQRMLYTPSGRPRLAVVSIAHLSDSERMFFVTLLLNEIVAWMRTQPGTTSLRALLYMDEVFGYFPPTANPPSKLPMLTLMKQARAYGLGVVLATQNPVDLDYKGLSNAGTWFIGRLQTERDKARLLDGLEGVSARSGGGFDRGEVERTISGLKSRVFLMNNVHDDHPEIFHTRWALSYLRGPLTRDQIRTLSKSAAEEKAEAPVVPPVETVEPSAATALDRPVLGPDVREAFARLRKSAPTGATLLYRPTLFARAQLHYVNQRADVDHWVSVSRLASLREDLPTDFWDGASAPAEPLEIESEPRPGIKFAGLPASAARKSSYTTWTKKLRTSLYRTAPLRLYRAPALRAYSLPDEDESAFRARVSQLAREKRDLAVEKLRRRYAPKLARLGERIRAAEGRVSQQQSRSTQAKLQTAISLGATVLGALFGRKAASVGTVGRATTTIRGAGRAAQRSEDVKRATDRLEDLRDQLQKLEVEFEDRASEVADEIDSSAVELVEYPVRPRKSDTEVEASLLLWTPWTVSLEGVAEPLF